VPDIHNTLYNYGTFQVQVSANLVSNWEGGEIVRFMAIRAPSSSPRGRQTGSVQPIEDYGYPLESWPKDTKDVFAAQHKNDPLADIGDRAPAAQTPNQCRSRGARRHGRPFPEPGSSASGPASSLWRT